MTRSLVSIPSNPRSTVHAKPSEKRSLMRDPPSYCATARCSGCRSVTDIDGALLVLVPDADSGPTVTILAYLPHAIDVTWITVLITVESPNGRRAGEFFGSVALPAKNEICSAIPEFQIA